MRSNLQKSKVVVITGASAGVGRAIARRFARDGARLALLARGRDGLEAARQEAEEIGGHATIFPLDVANAEAVFEAADRIEQELGPIDVWINNAMVSVYAPFKDISADEFRRVTEVTYLGFVHGTMAALRHMLPRDRGVIIQVGSALAYRSIPLQSAYCGAKHAIKGFTQSLRTELLHDRSKVRVTLVHLPAMNTPQFDWTLNRMGQQAQPVPPIFQPEVGADAVHWAAHHDRREVWVGRSTVKAIIGTRVAAAYADQVLADQGYSGQTTGEPEPPSPSNLWEPLPGDRGAHGRFDDRATAHSWQLQATKHRGTLVALAGLAGAAGLLALLMSRREEAEIDPSWRVENRPRSLPRGQSGEAPENTEEKSGEYRDERVPTRYSG